MQPFPIRSCCNLTLIIRQVVRRGRSSGMHTFSFKVPASFEISASSSNVAGIEVGEDGGGGLYFRISVSGLLL